MPKFFPLEGTFDVEDPGEYGHMMLKEIYEQPSSLSNALTGRISADGLSAELSGFTLSPDEMKKLDSYLKNGFKDEKLNKLKKSLTN